MNFILHLLIDAAIIFGLAYIMPQIHVKNFMTAVIVALLLGALNFLLGWLISFPLNLVSLFLLKGIVRIVVTALILKLIDKVMSDFQIDGFWPALVVAVAVAVAGSLIDSQQPAKQRTRANYRTTEVVSVIQPWLG